MRIRNHPNSASITLTQIADLDETFLGTRDVQERAGIGTVRTAVNRSSWFLPTWSAQATGDCNRPWGALV